jgi:hypothetical protein
MNRIITSKLNYYQERYIIIELIIIIYIDVCICKASVVSRCNILN